jgi:choline dehydrogenase
VRLHTHTLRIEIENGRTVGVTVAQGKESETLRADREVIVSCGAIGSPPPASAFGDRSRRRVEVCWRM